MIPSFAEIGLDAPAVEPEQIDGDYVQVAEAIDLASAARLQEHLQAAEIPAEIQEDLIGGAPYYRIFADGNVEATQLPRLTAVPSGWRPGGFWRGTKLWPLSSA